VSEEHLMGPSISVCPSRFPTVGPEVVIPIIIFFTPIGIPIPTVILIVTIGITIRIIIRGITTEIRPKIGKRISTGIRIIGTITIGIIRKLRTTIGIRITIGLTITIEHGKLKSSDAYTFK
jgi:hypothetical protein